MTVTLRPETRDDWPWLWHWRHEVDDPDWKNWDSPFLHEQSPHLSFAEFTHRRRLNPRLGAIIEHGGRPVGCVTRGELAPLGGGWWDWGIVIFDPADRQSGIGTRAGSMWIDDTFRRTAAHVLTLTTWSGNTGMLSTGARLGFVECTRIPEARMWRGRRYDSVQMALLRRDWESRHCSQAGGASAGA